MIDFNKPRVLLLSTNSDQAGAPLHVETLVHSLKNYIDFELIFGEDGPVGRRLAAQDFNVSVIPEMRSDFNFINDIRSYLKISKFIKTFHPNIIHAHSTKAAMIARMISYRHGIPCVYTVHGWGWRGLNFIARNMVFLIERVLSFSPLTRYIYVSKSVEIVAKSRLKISPRYGTVIYNGVPNVLSEIPAEANPFMHIIMPARVSRAKDHETIIRAFERITFPSKLILCGSGTDVESFKSNAKYWAPSRYPYIKFLGSRTDVHDLLAVSDVFALISNYEALPISIIEAMRSGMSIIATDVGGVSELIDNSYSGVLVKKGDVDSLVGAFFSMRDRSMRERLGTRAREKYLSCFTSEKMSLETFKFYRQIMIEVG
jgi:glycosyltransferase involved in cell wall biosynthesis